METLAIVTLGVFLVIHIGINFQREFLVAIMAQHTWRCKNKLYLLLVAMEYPLAIGVAYWLDNLVVYGLLAANYAVVSFSYLRVRNDKLVKGVRDGDVHQTVKTLNMA